MSQQNSLDLESKLIERTMLQRDEMIAKADAEAKTLIDNSEKEAQRLKSEADRQILNIVASVLRGVRDRIVGGVELDSRKKLMIARGDTPADIRRLREEAQGANLRQEGVSRDTSQTHRRSMHSNRRRGVHSLRERRRPSRNQEGAQEVRDRGPEGDRRQGHTQTRRLTNRHNRRSSRQEPRRHKSLPQHPRRKNTESTCQAQRPAHEDSGGRVKWESLV